MYSPISMETRVFLVTLLATTANPITLKYSCPFKVSNHIRHVYLMDDLSLKFGLINKQTYGIIHYTLCNSHDTHKAKKVQNKNIGWIKSGIVLSHWLVIVMNVEDKFQN